VLPIPPALASALASCQHAAVLTGAGISAESGIPTFRDPQQGLWSRYRPEDLATPEAFARDPDLVWQWYEWRRDLIARAQPNAGHLALAALERLLPRLTLVTQNVDGLHQRAGSTHVIEFHGNIHRNHCSVDGQPVTLETPSPRRAPRCPRCGGRVRPSVVWFGEAIPRPALEAASAAAANCDLFLSIGTSALVEPAAGLARIARDAGACLVEINPASTPASAQVDHALRGRAGDFLPSFVSALA
jgi:NAD-dependent deacetylase